MCTPTSLLSLNDDVLLHIFSFLYGQEAIAVALASKRLHDLAIPRVAAFAKCSSVATFLQLCKYILEGPGPRARYLEILDLRHLPCFDVFDNTAAGGSNPHLADTRLVIDLLMAAQNLRQLSLSHFLAGPPIPETHSTVGGAISTMRNLVDLSLFPVDDAALAILSQLRGSLLRLDLIFDFEGAASTRSAALVQALARHTCLRGLSLSYFRPIECFAHASLTSGIRFPSLRHLSLVAASEEALDLVGLCPQLSVLSVSLDRPDPPQQDTPPPGWPPLRELRLDGVALGRCVQHRVAQVEHLRLKSWDIAPYNWGKVQGPLAAILPVASPVQLSFFVIPEPTVVNALAPMLEALPRLRNLELGVILTKALIEDPSKEWLVAFLSLLSRLQLVSLRLVLPLVRPPFTDASSGARFPTLRGVDAWNRARRECEQRRADLAQSLPGQVVRASPPAMRLLGVAFQRWTNTREPPAPASEDADVDESPRRWYMPEWDSLRKRYPFNHWWWRVEGGELTAITSEQAKWAVREVLEESGRTRRSAGS